MVVVVAEVCPDVVRGSLSRFSSRVVNLKFFRGIPSVGKIASVVEKQEN